VNRNLPLLVPKATPDPDAACWAVVTQASPLRIKIDGESAALPFTPVTLVANLAVNDRVWIALATNADPSVKSRRVVILGRAGGGVDARNGVSLRRTSAQGPIVSGGGSAGIVWQVADYEVPEMWSSGETVTIPSNGIWSATFMTQWSGSIGAGRAFIAYTFSSGATYRLPFAGTSETFVTFNITIPMLATESFTARVFQTSGGNLDVINAALHVYRVAA